MSKIILSEATWNTVLAESSDQDRADAIASLHANGTKLVLLDVTGATLRTLTSTAWTRGAQEGNAFPIIPGTFTDAASGEGTPATVVITNSSDAEILRLPASEMGLALALVNGVAVVPGAFRYRYPASGTPPASGVKRWHPGHYFYTSQDWTHDVLMVESRRNKVKNNPHFAGYKLFAFWDKMESTAGTYNFGPVLAELDKVQADGKMAWVSIKERSFHGASRGLPCPQYVYDGSGTYASQTNGQNILAPKFWVPWVGEAFLAMVAAFMEAVDDHPALQGIQTGECSIAGSWLQPGYTWQAMNAFILEYCRVGSKGAIKSLWHQNMGWSNEPSSDTTEHYRMTDTVVRTYRAGCSPTDLNILTSWMATLSTTYGKYIYNRYAGETFFSVNTEDQSYRQAGHTAKSLIDFAVDRLGAHFIGWQATDYTASWVFTDADAIAEVTAQAGRINTTRPSNVPA